MLASVIMTVFNEEDYLQESIQSILNQSFKDFEFIIINDGSTDRTKDILAQINDRRVKVYQFEKNMGAAHGLNYAISHAKGKWIFVQDADDLSLPDRLKEQLNYLNQSPDTVALSSFIQCISGKKSISKNHLENYPKYWNSIVTSEDIDREVYYRTPFCHGSVAFSRNIFLQAGEYNPRFKIAYDYDLLSRMKEFGDFKKISKVLYYYRITKDSLAHKNILRTFNEAMIISSNFIYNHCYKNLNKKPILYLFGSTTAYPNFIQNVAPALTMDIYDYSSDESIENLLKVYNLYQKKEIDGIIFLKTNKANQEMINYFTNKGLSINSQLFRFFSLL